MKYTWIYETAIGKIGLTEEEENIVGLAMGEDLRVPDAARRETPLMRQTIREVEEYLAGSRRTFTVPVRTAGTPFQEKVWRALREIPYGETRTYGQIAAAVGSPKGARAVGMACNRNPVMLLIPCHRVIGSDGSLTGFGGGLPLKEKLLRLEKVSKKP